MEIISNSSSILNQLIDLIKSLSREEYTNQLKVLNGSTVGQHVRHVLEFYIEFEKGYKIGTIAYDNRIRNLEFEVNQELVIRELQNIINQLNNHNLEKDLLLESNHGLSNKDIVKSKTSCRREIVYVLDHAVHHLAIIKIAMQVAYSHIELNTNLGIAPSTLRNNK
jgi:uncharacterized damage-inducible protein DinB